MKKTFLNVVLCLILFCNNASSQSPQLSWAHAFQVNAALSLITPRYMETDANNNCIVSGDFYGQVDFDLDTTQQNLLTSITNKDYFLAKYNPLGSLQWVIHFKPTVLNNVYFYHVSCDLQNNIFIWGNTKDTIDVDPSPAVFNIQPPAGKSMGFILKYDASGNLSAAREVGVTTDLTITTLTSNKQNELYLWGSILDTVDLDFGAGVAYDTIPVSGNKRFILKMDNNLNYVWHRSIVGANSLTLADLAFDSQSNLYFTGNFNASTDFNPGPANFTLNTQGGNDSFILSLDGSGNFIKAWKIANCTGNDFGQKILFDENDFMYVYGSWSNVISFGNGTFSMTAPGSSYNDYYLMKADINGNVLWAERIGIFIDGFSNVIASEIKYDQVNGFLMSGYFTTPFDFDPSPTGTFLVTPQGSDAFLLNLDPNGHFKSVNVYSSTGTELMYCMTNTPQGNIYCGGTFRFSVDFDGGPGQYILTCLAPSTTSGFIFSLNDKTNFVTGRTFRDQNLNSIYDGLDYPLSNCIVKTSEGRNFITSNTGTYLAFCDTGTIDISYNNLPVAATSIPSIHTIVNSTYNNLSSNNDFAIQVPSGTQNGVITFTNINRTRPGLFSYLKISYKNIGTTALSGDIKVVLDNRLNFTSSNPSPLLTNTDTVYYTYSNLLPLETRDIDLMVLVDGGIPIFTNLVSYAELISNTGDIDFSDNTDTLNQMIFASYDPNDKQVIPSGNFTNQQILNGEYLEYIIRFQNTGNDTAFVVQIEDTISPYLDLSTFEIISQSHSSFVQLTGNNIIRFIFNNILLPDSTTNEAASHGFIRYRIKVLTSTSIGSIINNTGYIYFDLNTAIVTNTVSSEITTVASVFETSSLINPYKIYPIPANNSVNIESLSNKKFNMEVYTLTGDLVIVEENLFGNQQLSTEKLKSGFYLLKLSNEDGIKSYKLILAH